jgi:hypothetical protein
MKINRDLMHYLLKEQDPDAYAEDLAEQEKFAFDIEGSA